MKPTFLASIILLTASSAFGQYYGSISGTFGPQTPMNWNNFNPSPIMSFSMPRGTPISPIQGVPFTGKPIDYRSTNEIVSSEMKIANTTLQSITLPPKIPPSATPGPPLILESIPPVEPKASMSAESEKNWEILTGEARNKVIEKFACEVAERGEKILMTKIAEASKAASNLSQTSAEKATAIKELQQSSKELTKARSSAAARTGTPAQMAEREANLIRAENHAAEAFAKTAQAEAKEVFAKGASEVAAKQAGRQFAKQVIKGVIASAAKVIERVGVILIMFDATPTGGPDDQPFPNNE